jgi:hypothetical protein
MVMHHTAFVVPLYQDRDVSSNGLRNMAHEINAFVKEGRDVKVEYHNIITKDYGFVTATIPEQTNP